MAGYPITTESMNARVGYLAVTLDQVLDGWVTIKQFCDANPASDFGLGMAANDVTRIRAAAAAMAKLSAISHGQDTQSPASDFWWDAKYLMGLE